MGCDASAWARRLLGLTWTFKVTHEPMSAGWSGILVTQAGNLYEVGKTISSPSTIQSPKPINSTSICVLFSNPYILQSWPPMIPLKLWILQSFNKYLNGYCRPGIVLGPRNPRETNTL